MRKLKQLALNMVEQGTQETTYGNWTFSTAYDQLADDLEKEIASLTETEIKELVEELSLCKEVAEVDYNGDEISIYFYLDYCPFVEDEDEEEEE